MKNKVISKVELRKKALADFFKCNESEISVVKGEYCTYTYKDVHYQLSTRKECKFYHGIDPDDYSVQDKVKEQYLGVAHGLLHGQVFGYYVSIVKLTAGDN